MGLIDNVKAVAKTVQQIDNVELYRQILELQAEALELVEENNNLRHELAQLQERTGLSAELLVDQDCYWTSEDGETDGPFCTNCWDLGKGLIRMWRCGNPKYSECPNCKRALPVRGR